MSAWIPMRYQSSWQCRQKEHPEKEQTRRGLDQNGYQNGLLSTSVTLEAELLIGFHISRNSQAPQVQKIYEPHVVPAGQGS